MRSIPIAPALASLALLCGCVTLQTYKPTLVGTAPDGKPMYSINGITLIGENDESYARGYAAKYSQGMCDTKATVQQVTIKHGPDALTWYATFSCDAIRGGY